MHLRRAQAQRMVITIILIIGGGLYMINLTGKVQRSSRFCHFPNCSCVHLCKLNLMFTNVNCSVHQCKLNLVLTSANCTRAQCTHTWYPSKKIQHYTVCSTHSTGLNQLLHLMDVAHFRCCIERETKLHMLHLAYLFRILHTWCLSQMHPFWMVPHTSYCLLHTKDSTLGTAQCWLLAVWTLIRDPSSLHLAHNTWTPCTLQTYELTK